MIEDYNFFEDKREYTMTSIKLKGDNNNPFSSTTPKSIKNKSNNGGSSNNNKSPSKLELKHARSENNMD